MDRYIASLSSLADRYSLSWAAQDVIDALKPGTRAGLESSAHIFHQVSRALYTSTKVDEDQLPYHIIGSVDAKDTKRLMNHLKGVSYFEYWSRAVGAVNTPKHRSRRRALESLQNSAAI